jgi:hypothetical protein
METNLNTLYRSAMKKDFVKYEIIPRQTPEQTCSSQKRFTNRLCQPKHKEEEVVKKKLSISFYSAEDAARDKKLMDERRAKYESFVAEKTQKAYANTKDSSWRAP